jgi:hypothetical protein
MIGQPHIREVHFHLLGALLALQFPLLYLLDDLKMVVSPVERLLNEMVDVNLLILAVVLLSFVADLQAFEAVANVLDFAAGSTGTLQNAFSA